MKELDISQIIQNTDNRVTMIRIIEEVCFIFFSQNIFKTLFQVPETKHGGIGLYQCKDGYKLKGADTTECRYGNWTNTTPRCEEVYCKFPGTIENGKVYLLSILKSMFLFLNHIECAD